MTRSTDGKAVRLGIRENWPQFSLLVLINACVGGMVGLERTVVPLIATQEFQLTSDTLIFSFIVAFGVVKALANVAAGMLADRFTRKAMLVGGWVIGLPVPFMLAWGPSWNWILAANVLLGASQGFTWSMTITMKNDLAKSSQRGLAMGLNEFAGYGGLGVTALLTGYIAARAGLRPEPFYLGIAYAVLGLGLSIAAIRDTSPYRHQLEPQASDSRVRTRNGPSSKRTMFAACQAGLVNNLNDAISWCVLPLFFAAHGVVIEDIGIIKAVYPLTWSVGQLATGGLADRFGRRPLIMWGMIVQAVGLAVIALNIGSALINGLTGAVLLGVGTAMAYPALLALVADVSAPAQRATTLGWYRFWRDLGYPSGALLAGVVSTAFGFEWAVGLAAVLTLLSGLVAAASIGPEWRWRARGRVPATLIVRGLVEGQNDNA